MIKSASSLAIGVGIESVSSFAIGAGKKRRHNDRIHLQLRIGTGIEFASSLAIRSRVSSRDRSYPSRRREIGRCNLSSDLFRFGLLHPRVIMAKEIRSPPWLRCDAASPAHCVLMSKILDTTSDGITRRDQYCTFMFHLVACKREALWSKEDISRVSIKDILMLKSVFSMGSGPRVTLIGRIPSGPNGSLVLVQAASTVSIRSGGRGWCRSRDKNKYNDRYQMSGVRCQVSGVRWCRVVGVACLVTVQLLAELPTTAEKTFICKPHSGCTRSSEKVIPPSSLYSYFGKMSDLSGDSEKDNFSEEVGIIGSSESTDSPDSIDCTADFAEQARRTPDNLSGI
ncbi:hypothetical protein TIFTF001_037698 [Ficus carica]|uniref:Uncharacterized protein n=1 Tax=Ficus carica TaxID=3494 RepID=A0AA88JDV4_FICCA|nr:hypothetical protein TIFTF001_037698 [Ficus carica]